MDVDDQRMVLKITANAMKCPLFTQLDHENYDALGTYDLTTVKDYWVKKYKAHKKYNRDQEGTNEYESAAFAVPPPNDVGNDYDTYVSALEDVIARQVVDREEAFATKTTVTASTAPTQFSMADIMAEIKKEMATMIKTMAPPTVDPGKGGGRNKRRGFTADGKELPKCPHCGKAAMHKPDDCFSLPQNAEKMKTANFVDGKFVKKE